MRFCARDVVDATGGRLRAAEAGVEAVAAGEVVIDGVSFDSRSLQAGQLFVPIVAERDGHDFIAAAESRGAAAYLTSRAAVAGLTIPAIEVSDTSRALMQLAAARRPTFTGPVVGITGSVGKTTTKDLARAALGSVLRTWANERSFNNEQGLPTTLLNAPDGTEVMVLEMGMRGLGEIAELCAIAAPTIGVVTRVAEAHGDRVGGIEGVARAKAELVEALPRDGLAVLNHDDVRVRAMASLASGRVLFYGESSDPHVDVRIGEVHLDDLGRPVFRIDTPWGGAQVRLGASGRHMAHNAAAALACAGAVGVGLAAAVEALFDVGLSPMRMDLRRLANGAVLLDDSYNANPTSVRAALDTLAALPAARRRAVLGVMAEIEEPAREHRAIVEYARGLGVEVFAVGTELYGLPPVADPVGAVAPLAAGDAVLVKGSRVAGLDRLVHELVGRTLVDGADVAPPRE